MNRHQRRIINSISDQIDNMEFQEELLDDAEFWRGQRQGQNAIALMENNCQEIFQNLSSKNQQMAMQLHCMEQQASQSDWGF
jgi:hypothetical protein